MRADSLPSEPPGKPKNTGVGSLLGDLLDPGIEPGSPTLKVDSLQVKLPGKPGTIFNITLLYTCNLLSVLVSSFHTHTQRVVV